MSSGINTYEGGMKSFWPTLCETQDKRPLVRELDSSSCHCHTTSMIKLFWTQPRLHGHRAQHTGKVKSSRPIPYNRCKTRDKRPLVKDLDRSWCHYHTPVKLSGSQLMDSWTERQHARMLRPMSMEPWTATKKALTSVEMTLAPVRVPTQ